MVHPGSSPLPRQVPVCLGWRREGGPGPLESLRPRKFTVHQDVGGGGWVGGSAVHGVLFNVSVHWDPLGFDEFAKKFWWYPSLMTGSLTSVHVFRGLEVNVVSMDGAPCPPLARALRGGVPRGGALRGGGFRGGGTSGRGTSGRGCLGAGPFGSGPSERER